MSRGDWLVAWQAQQPLPTGNRKERSVDLVEWQLIRDAEVGLYWVAEHHALGLDPQSRRVRERLLVALYGPFTPAQAEQIRQAHVDFRLLGEPAYWDLDAAERMPPDYAVQAHLGDDILEPTPSVVEEEEEL